MSKNPFVIFIYPPGASSLGDAMRIKLFRRKKEAKAKKEKQLPKKLMAYKLLSEVEELMECHQDIKGKVVVELEKPEGKIFIDKSVQPVVEKAVEIEKAEVEKEIKKEVNNNLMNEQEKKKRVSETLKRIALFIISTAALTLGVVELNIGTLLPEGLDRGPFGVGLISLMIGLGLGLGWLYMLLEEDK